MSKLKYTIESVIFFEKKNKKYVTDNGLVITAEMIAESKSHYISNDLCYIILSESQIHALKSNR